MSGTNRILTRSKKKANKAKTKNVEAHTIQDMIAYREQLRSALSNAEIQISGMMQMLGTCWGCGALGVPYRDVAITCVREKRNSTALDIARAAAASDKQVIFTFPIDHFDFDPFALPHVPQLIRDMLAGANGNSEMLGRMTVPICPCCANGNTPGIGAIDLPPELHALYPQIDVRDWSQFIKTPIKAEDIFYSDNPLEKLVSQMTSLKDRMIATESALTAKDGPSEAEAECEAEHDVDDRPDFEGDELNQSQFEPRDPVLEIPTVEK